MKLWKSTHYILGSSTLKGLRVFVSIFIFLPDPTIVGRSGMYYLFTKRVCSPVRQASHPPVHISQPNQTVRN